MSSPLRTLKRAILRMHGTGGSARIRRQLKAREEHAKRQKALQTGLRASLAPKPEPATHRLKKFLRRVFQ